MFSGTVEFVLLGKLVWFTYHDVIIGHVDGHVWVGLLFEFVYTPVQLNC